MEPIHVHDFQSTVVQLLGLDHMKLTYNFQGRNFRLTDVGQPRSCETLPLVKEFWAFDGNRFGIEVAKVTKVGLGANMVISNLKVSR